MPKSNETDTVNKTVWQWKKAAFYFKFQKYLNAVMVILDAMCSVLKI